MIRRGHGLRPLPFPLHPETRKKIVKPETYQPSTVASGGSGGALAAGEHGGGVVGEGRVGVLAADIPGVDQGRGSGFTEPHLGGFLRQFISIRRGDGEQSIDTLLVVVLLGLDLLERVTASFSIIEPDLTRISRLKWQSRFQ